ncbi:hypothetical protein BGZ94_008710 [Podila epigama]|nr:hypothetical protein BGZ94_008710 [Podila epigama]
MAGSRSPLVLIVGAGLGGLTTALLCEVAGIDYLVFERAAKVKPLGSVITLSPNILPVFEQLGMLQDLEALSTTCDNMELFYQDFTPIGKIDGRGFTETTGYKALLFSRPDLYAYLLSKIPPAKLNMNKRVLSIQQNSEDVLIRCSDNSEYYGDILIGADGAYSGVRQSLYKQLEKHGHLPSEDKEDMTVGYICMVGTTRPLDPETYPALKDPRCQFTTILGENSRYSWTTATLPGNRIAWSTKFQVDVETAKDMTFRNSEWGPESNAAMIEELNNFPIRDGHKLGDVIEATDKDLISKVYLEEKLFKTWTYGRVALIGDGAVSAMQDATILVNAIYEIAQDATYKNIKEALEDYRAQRFDRAAGQVNMSKMLAKIIAGQKWSERALRHFIYNCPKWIQTRNWTKMATYRPMVAFLPPVPNRTNLKLEPQKPSKRYAKEQAAKNRTASAI